jgi:peptidoglycan/xylan/chitin deacetylase (PgdA/CDA1 family)
MIAQWLGLNPATSVAQMLRFAVDNYTPGTVEELLPRLRAQTGVDQRVLARTHRLHLESAQIAEMSAAGISFGNHTCSHAPLALLELEAARDEIRGACFALNHLPGANESLAYPFGSRCEDIRRIALELGIRTILEVEGVNSPLDPTRIGRIKVGSDSVPVLFARMEVVEPIKWRLKCWIRRLGFRLQ